MSSGNRTLVVALAGVLGFCIPGAILYFGDPSVVGSFAERLFGGTTLCGMITLLATTVSWLAFAEPGTRRRNGSLLGVLLGLAAGFGACAWLVYTDWSAVTATTKFFGFIAAIPLGMLVGFFVGFLIARGAPRPLRSGPGGGFHPY